MQINQVNDVEQALLNPSSRRSSDDLSQRNTESTLGAGTTGTGTGSEYVVITPSMSRSPLINPNSIANVTTALAMTCLVSTVAFITDVLSYWAYCAYKEESIAHSKEVPEFAFFPVCGGLAAGAFIWLLLMVTGKSAQLLAPENKLMMNLYLGVALAVNSVCAAAIVLLSQNASFRYWRAPCMTMLTSLGIGLALDFLLLASFLYCGGTKNIAWTISMLHSSVKELADKVIGEGSNYSEGNYQACLGDCGVVLTSCCASIWSRKDQGSSDFSQSAFAGEQVYSPVRTAASN